MSGRMLVAERGGGSSAIFLRPLAHVIPHEWVRRDGVCQEKAARIGPIAVGDGWSSLVDGHLSIYRRAS